MTRIAPAFALALASLIPTLAPAATATFAGGCFWCVESDFERVPGVGDVVSGFTGGSTANPVYRRSGDHIEAVEIPYDPATVNYATLVSLFLRSIDPLDAGGQFCDRGLEYTSAIFPATPEEDAIARAALAEAAAELGQPVATKIIPAGTFYPVDDYHQDYYKSDDRLGITSVGVFVTKADAYKRYRKGCGRDERVRAVWGDDAPFLP
ncbi:peptide-methionine (S)-S-oxide reductase MsrA [uncultured Jannaschia sp.]|uniref:peptide-methionine (S)-S-oxide reductase MsrA n=1 Tax=uncultured Jannaschia sp. TaxID=293347 RepID=UPI002629A55B|nr:peptide-methionine (S)-S-oxide reductase MsrA [uncultured Jannaschia sp.]